MGDILMLFRHILDRDGQKFAIVLGVIEHRARIEGVDVDFDDVLIPHQNEGFAMGGQEILEFLLDEGLLAIFGLAQTENELGAIAIAFFVFGKLGAGVLAIRGA
jgi:hypothetical protein